MVIDFTNEDLLYLLAYDLYQINFFGDPKYTVILKDCKTFSNSDLNTALFEAFVYTTGR